MSEPITTQDRQSNPRTRFWKLALGSIGVVFGDIGTSPIYAMREALAHTRSGTAQDVAVLGVVSLIFWALILIVTLKYVFILMTADNKGEGGTLALMALAQGALKKPSKIVFILGICGAALFYGDGIITPAVSVVGAVEGLGEAPGIGSVLRPLILPISLGVLVTLFLVQSRGTSAVGRLFGPITAIWFLTIAGLGLLHIFDDPSVLRALSPHYAFLFLVNNGVTSFAILGSVFLAVTGAEALYADMGHFGRKPIRFVWLLFILPCLVLNYLGQGALVLSDPTAAENPFFRMIPTEAYWPVLLLATAAAVIASQAVISGAFSLTQQAVQLGLLPRMRILRTSETEAGQIFVPSVNWMLLAGVVILVVTMRTSTNLTGAYGIAVTGAMFVDTLLLFVVLRHLWKRSIVEAISCVVAFGLIDAIFLSSNLLKIPQGAWIPLTLGAVLVTMMWTWQRGVRVLTEKARQETVKMSELVTMLQAKMPPRTPGTAIFLTADPEFAPTALLHNLKHNRVLHAKNILLTVQTRNTPRVDLSERVQIETINEDFKRVSIRFGFMEMPNLPQALAQCRREGLRFDIMLTSFFLSRRTLIASPTTGMPLWQDHVFIFMARNAGNPAEYFRLPAGRVVEMGAQVTI